MDLTGFIEQCRATVRVLKACTFGLVSFLAAACDSKEQAVAKCEVETLNLYPNAATSDAYVQPYLRACVQAAGFEFKPIWGRCDALEGANSPACYRSQFDSYLRSWM